MNRKRRGSGSLGPYRVLDLSDEKGYLCGKILADLGADVIKVESPGGDSARRIGPFHLDSPDPERSLFWFAYNAGKRGITLNLDTGDGREILRKLVTTADFLVESFPPGHMEAWGLGFAALNRINPRIIVISVSPFGQNGPYRRYTARDIVAMGMGGLMHLTGNPDRAPVRISEPQAYLQAGLEAAVGAVIAHYHREGNGPGQHVDVSAQASICWSLINARLVWETQGVKLQRSGSFRGGISSGGGKIQSAWPCKDGHVAFTIIGGSMGARNNRPLVEWMDSEGMAPDFLKAWDWESFDFSVATAQDFARLSEPIGAFFLAHTKTELYEGALARHIMLCPLNTVEDIVHDAQLQSRGFWRQLPHPELGTSIAYPGAFARLSEAPCELSGRAPLIGEHNEGIYEGELGLSREDLLLLKQANII